MASILYSGLVTDVSGRLGGSVANVNSYGTNLGKLNLPPYTASNATSPVRSRFGYISQAWRDLTQMERDNWDAIATGGISGFELFVGRSVVTVTNAGVLATPSVAPTTFPVWVTGAAPQAGEVRLFEVAYASSLPSPAPPQVLVSLSPNYSNPDVGYELWASNPLASQGQAEAAQVFRVGSVINDWFDHDFGFDYLNVRGNFSTGQWFKSELRTFSVSKGTFGPVISYISIAF